MNQPPTERHRFFSLSHQRFTAPAALFLQTTPGYDTSPHTLHLLYRNGYLTEAIGYLEGDFERRGRVAHLEDEERGKW